MHDIGFDNAYPQFARVSLTNCKTLADYIYQCLSDSLDMVYTDINAVKTFSKDDSDNIFLLTFDLRLNKQK
ncbi:hypothetical protein PS15m_007869 [Mucor circinelloides]